MSLDITTLRLLKYRTRHNKLAKFVPKRALSAHTQILFDDFGAFFKEFPDTQVIPAEAFMLWFKGFRHKNLKDEALAVFDHVIKQVVAEDVDPAIESGLLRRLVEAASACDIMAHIERYNAGEEIDLRGSLSEVIDAYDAQVQRTIKDPQVLDRIEDLLAEEENDTGFKWPWPCMNRHMRPLRGGDFVVVAARPDKGKTTWCSHALTHMAAQVDAMYPGEKRSILWFNNEGPGKRIVQRCFQSALNATIPDLIAKSNAGTIRQEYATALGGRGGTLRIMDIHGWWNHEVEEVIARYRPAGVLFDMIDNIRFGGELANGGQRTDQILESMYQWGRLLGVKYDCWTMATSQISADGDGLQFPTQPMLKDSKTGKQGAADVIVTIGAVNDPMLEKTRWFGTTKSKLVRSGVAASPRQEVLFDSDRGRYVELQS
jgi:replicative DNA helicase